MLKKELPSFLSSSCPAIIKRPDFEKTQKVRLICCNQEKEYHEVLDLVKEMRDHAVEIIKGNKEVIWGVWCCRDYLNFLPPPKKVLRYASLDDIAEYLIFESHFKKYLAAMEQDIEIAELSGTEAPALKFEPIKSNARMVWLLSQKN